MLEELLDLYTFELEYSHRMTSYTFSEKWINTTRSRARTRKLKKYLFSHVTIILKTECREDFYTTALRPILHKSYKEMDLSLQKTPLTDPENEIYLQIFYHLPLKDLFILFTNVINWEHQAYPALLEYMLIEKFNNKDVDQLELKDDLLRYYIRFLDVLSSNEIISLFDLDALRNTLRLDAEKITRKPLEDSILYTDWPVTNATPFEQRFPSFKDNIIKKQVHI